MIETRIDFSWNCMIQEIFKNSDRIFKFETFEKNLMDYGVRALVDW